MHDFQIGSYTKYFNSNRKMFKQGTKATTSNFMDEINERIERGNYLTRHIHGPSEVFIFTRGQFK